MFEEQAGIAALERPPRSAPSGPDRADRTDAAARPDRAPAPCPRPSTGAPAGARRDRAGGSGTRVGEAGIQAGFHRAGWLSPDAEPDRLVAPRVGVTWPRAPWSRDKISAHITEQIAASETAKARERAMQNMVRPAVQEAYVRAKSAQDRAALLRTTILPQVCLYFFNSSSITFLKTGYGCGPPMTRLLMKKVGVPRMPTLSPAALSLATSSLSGQSRGIRRMPSFRGRWPWPTSSGPQP